MSHDEPAITAVVDGAVRPHVPGAAVAVLRDGVLVDERAVGVGDLDTATPVTPGSAPGHVWKVLAVSVVMIRPSDTRRQPEPSTR